MVTAQSLQISNDKNGVLLSLRAKPRARCNALEGIREGRIIIAVTATPHDGEANAAVIEVLSRALRVSKTSLEIVRGHKAREKTVRIFGLDENEVRTRLETLLANP